MAYPIGDTDEGRYLDWDFWINTMWTFSEIRNGLGTHQNRTLVNGVEMKSRVEEKMIKDFPDNKFAKVELMSALDHVLNEMQNETELFQNLQESYPEKLQAMIAANVSRTDF